MGKGIRSTDGDGQVGMSGVPSAQSGLVRASEGAILRQNERRLRVIPFKLELTL